MGRRGGGWEGGWWCWRGSPVRASIRVRAHMCGWVGGCVGRRGSWVGRGRRFAWVGAEPLQRPTVAIACYADIYLAGDDDECFLCRHHAGALDYSGASAKIKARSGQSANANERLGNSHSGESNHLDSGTFGVIVASLPLPLPIMRGAISLPLPLFVHDFRNSKPIPSLLLAHSPPERPAC